MSLYSLNHLSDELFGFSPQNYVDSELNSSLTPLFRSKNPMVTGSSVLGIKCCDSVIIVSDTLGSYGSMARFRNLPRIISVGDNVVLAVSGDYADFQYLKDLLDSKVRKSRLLSDKNSLTPQAIHSWLTRIIYHRRTKLNPLWNSILVAGWSDDSTPCPFLSYIDMIGVSYEDNCIATGLGSYLAKPLMRRKIRDLSNSLLQKQGISILTDCMKVLFYRDGRAFPRFQFTIVNGQGVDIQAPRENFGDWEVAEYVLGYD